MGNNKKLSHCSQLYIYMLLRLIKHSTQLMKTLALKWNSKTSVHIPNITYMLRVSVKSNTLLSPRGLFRWNPQFAPSALVVRKTKFYMEHASGLCTCAGNWVNFKCFNAFKVVSTKCAKRVLTIVRKAYIALTINTTLRGALSFFRTCFAACANTSHSRRNSPTRSGCSARVIGSM